MNNAVAIIGGTGQFGLTLAEKLIKKNNNIIITTRSVSRARKKIRKLKKIKIRKLDVLNKNQITKFLFKFKPKEIFYFAGQSSPALSFKRPNETYLSNFVGCKNFLEVIYLNNLKCKFINSSSCEIFGNINKKINLSTKKKPISPYGKAKLYSFNITKKFRENKSVSAYNAVIFNTESILRNKNFLIPKICMSAIRAKKFKKKTAFGNLNISREWNWCPEQCDAIIKLIKKKPHDFILSNRKLYSAIKMLEFAFGYFKLNYKDYIYFDKKYLRNKDITFVKSDYTGIKRIDLIYGKKLVYKLIKYFLTR